MLEPIRLDEELRAWRKFYDSVDPLYVELPTCAPRPRRYTVSNRGPHALTRPMTDWLHGLAIGLALGVPVAIFLGYVDRWLDVHWGR